MAAEWDWHAGDDLNALPCMLSNGLPHVTLHAACCVLHGPCRLLSAACCLFRRGGARMDPNLHAVRAARDRAPAPLGHLSSQKDCGAMPTAGSAAYVCPYGGCDESTVSLKPLSSMLLCRCRGCTINSLVCDTSSWCAIPAAGVRYQQPIRTTVPTHPVPSAAPAS